VLVLEFCGKRSGRRYRMPGFLRHNVHDANHYGVVLDDAGRPGEASLAALAESPDTKVITVSVGAGG
jgi:hypothetical protein